MEALFLLVSQFTVGAKHDLEMAREVFFAKKFRNPGDTLALFARNLQQGRVFSGDLRDRGIAQKTHQLPREVRWAVAFADEMVDLPQNLFAGAASYRLHHLFQNVGRRGAHKIAYRIGGYFTFAAGDRLIENRERIAHGAVAS